MQNQENKTQTSNSENELKTPPINVKVFYAKGILVHIKNKSFKEAMNLIWVSPAFSDYEPMKVQFTSTGKILYADRQAFLHYLEGKFNLEALIQHTQCDELYRNKRDFLTESAIVIDAGSLWKAKRNELTLIDDDNIYTTDIDLTEFEIAE
jgi:hypothetical protein